MIKREHRCYYRLTWVDALYSKWLCEWLFRNVNTSYSVFSPPGEKWIINLFSDPLGF